MEGLEVECVAMVEGEDRWRAEGSSKGDKTLVNLPNFPSFTPSLPQHHLHPTLSQPLQHPPSALSSTLQHRHHLTSHGGGDEREKVGEKTRAPSRSLATNYSSLILSVIGKLGGDSSYTCHKSFANSDQTPLTQAGGLGWAGQGERRV